MKFLKQKLAILLSYLQKKKILKVNIIIIVVKEEVLEPVPGRKLKIPRSCNKVCSYYFHELMESVMGDSDFRAICKNYKAIIIRNMR